ncbi:homoserine dehydrogenase [Halobacillus ihumii]|uniref:homoserine dehydrogenase n=1 Tax=Halobacillus ihumii TaxID=2686092 RepID=UPI0013D309E3|nr:homoserine dehydrogenase [Halobacillus ihumii]
MTHKLAFVGFGVVGSGLAEILLDKQDMLANQVGLDAEIVAISDLNLGSIYHPEGLNLQTLLDVVNEDNSLENYPEHPGLIRGWDSLQTIRETNADTIVEVTPTDVETGQPAIDHCREAFKNKKNLITTNKGPVALQYKELSSLAEENGVGWGFEGTVMSGTPTLRMPAVSLSGNNIREIRGILNGTTNFILSKMEEDMTYDDALAQAQDHGYAEADPTSDVEGHDILYKVVILANVVMDVPLVKDEVECQGMTDLTAEDIEEAKSEGKRWKLLARITQQDGKVQASVKPEKLSLDESLASVMGAANAITYECDLSGPVTVTGAGAGRIETGFSLLTDLININQTRIYEMR